VVATANAHRDLGQRTSAAAGGERKLAATLPGAEPLDWPGLATRTSSMEQERFGVSSFEGVCQSRKRED